MLLVDDVVEERRLVRTALRFRGDFEVVGEAADGREAVTLAGDLQPDIVVLDIGLPDLAGQEVLSGIRGASPETRVVVFSGSEPASSPGIAEHVEAYVLKDADIDYLTDLLEAVGRRPAVQASLELPGDITSPRDARVFVRNTLESWEGSDRVLDDALLVVTELVANAVTHAGTRCVVRLSKGPNSVRVEVIDFGGGTPDPMPPSITRNHGRGLHLIDALTAAWGVEPVAPDGKMVWAELMRNGDSSQHQSLSN